MKKNRLIIIMAVLFISPCVKAQHGSNAGQWKTWFISAGKDYRLPAPPSNKEDIDRIISIQQHLDSVSKSRIIFWNAGSPGYHWQAFINSIWMTDTSKYAPLAYMLMSVATYDATVAAWDNKYTFKRPRPFEADKRIKLYGLKPQSPSYPCEHAVAAGVASTIIGHFFPSLKDSVNRMAEQQMASRVAAGISFPGDTKAGFELGRKIAQKEIEATNGYVVSTPWDGKMPQQEGIWKGKYPMAILAAKNKTVILDSSSQYRPGPPPDFAKDMEELKKFKPTFRSMSNAFFWASQPFWEDQLNKKMFEQNIHLDPPAAARFYAITAITIYDGFSACWDAKYTYWGIRPDQYDTTYRPALIFTPPFPGYPSGHAVISGALAELYAYFFPADQAYFRKRAKDAAESRFQGGIHFRTDNEVGLDLGRKVAAAVIKKIDHEISSR